MQLVAWSKQWHFLLCSSNSLFSSPSIHPSIFLVVFATFSFRCFVIFSITIRVACNMSHDSDDLAHFCPLSSRLTLVRMIEVTLNVLKDGNLTSKDSTSPALRYLSRKSSTHEAVTRLQDCATIQLEGKEVQDYGVKIMLYSWILHPHNSIGTSAVQDQFEGQVK